MPDLPGTGSLALDTDGNPVVAFNKQSPTSSSGTLGVARYATGAIWDFSLGSPTSTGIYGSPPLSIDGTGAPAVVWSDVTAIYVARWNGSLWETLPGNSDPQQYMGLDVVSRRAVFLAYGPDGLPTIAFEGTSGANNGFAFVAKWSGSAWELLMSTDAPLGRAVYAMVLDAAGSPYILANVNSVLTVEHLDQSGWRSFDMSSLAFPELSYALALDSQERPGILTADLESGAEVIRGFYFSSNTWQSWTGNLVIGSNSIFSQLLVDSGGDPMVLWQQVDASNSTQLGHLSRYRIVGWDEPFGVVPAPATAAVMDSNDVPTVIAGSTVYRANHL
jgi:hypothetical protein